MGRPNMSREDKISAANGERQKKNPCSANKHKQDWQPYPVSAQSAISDDHTDWYEYGGSIS